MSAFGLFALGFMMFPVFALGIYLTLHVAARIALRFTGGQK